MLFVSDSIVLSWLKQSINFYRPVHAAVTWPLQMSGSTVPEIISVGRGVTRHPLLHASDIVSMSMTFAIGWQQIVCRWMLLRLELLWAGSKHNILLLGSHAAVCISAQILWLSVIMYGCSESLFSFDLSLEKHVSKMCSASFVNFVESESLDDGSAATLVHAFVTSRVDYQWSVTHRNSTAVWRHSCTMSSIGWTCQRESPISWASWCTAVFTVWHLGTSSTISLLPLTSLHSFVRVPQTNISLLYLAVDSIHTAVGHFWLPVQRSGIRCHASWEIQHVVLTVLNSFSWQSFLVSTAVTSALEVFLNDMRYINSRFTYLLTYALMAFHQVLSVVVVFAISGVTSNFSTLLQKAAWGPPLLARSSAKLFVLLWHLNMHRLMF